MTSSRDEFIYNQSQWSSLMAEASDSRKYIAEKGTLDSLEI